MVQFQILLPGLARDFQGLISEEKSFIEYFSLIDLNCIASIANAYAGTVPKGYGASLVLARMIKVKERILVTYDYIMTGDLSPVLILIIEQAQIIQKGKYHMLKISLQEKKDYIAKIAAKAFSEKGYQLASLQDLSNEVGISKAGIYHYFKSKEDILGYLMLTYSDRFLEILQSCVKKNEEQGLNPEDAFTQLMRTYANYINSDSDQRTIILRERHQLTDGYKRELLQKEQAMFRLLRNELQKIHNLNESIDPNAITFLFIAMSHWLGYWVKEGGKFTLEEIIEQNISIIFKGSIYGDQLRHSSLEADPPMSPEATFQEKSMEIY
jgi:AcrR family transcriptional regulator